MEILKYVKARLGITKNIRDDYLIAIITAIEKELREVHGILINVNNPVHVAFIGDYAVFRYLNKDKETGIPRHLQWRLHNLFVGD